MLFLLARRDERPRETLHLLTLSLIPGFVVSFNFLVFREARGHILERLRDVADIGRGEGEKRCVSELIIWNIRILAA